MLKLSTIGLVAGLLTLGVLNASGADSPMAGSWKHYPAFDHTSKTYYLPSHVAKVMDGQRFVYYWCLEAPHIKTATEAPYDKPITTLWVVDKSKMDAEGNFTAEHYTDIFDVAPQNIDRVYYNTRQGYLVAVNTNASVDILWDNGKAVHAGALESLVSPISTKTNDVVFDQERRLAYVSTDCGVYALDPETGVMKEFMRTNSKVQSFGRVCGYWILSDGDHLFEMEDKGSFPTSLASFSPLIVDENGFPADLIGKKDAEGNYTQHPWSKYEPGRLPCSYSIMPIETIADGAFYCISRKRWGANGADATTAPAATQIYIGWSVIRMPDGIWHSTYETTFTPLARSNVYVNDSADALIQVTKDGYGLATSTYWYNYSTDGIEFNYSTKKWKKSPISYATYPQPSGTITEDIRYGETMDRTRLGSSYDMTDIWIYHPYRGFYHRPYTAKNATSGTWGETSMRALPNAPACAYADDFEWNPKHGMLVRNLGHKWQTSVSHRQGDALSALKDGQWTCYSASLHSPDISGWLYSTSTAGMVSNPMGCAVDPLNPDHVYTAVKTHGLVRQDLSNPDGLLNFTRGNSEFKAYPSFVDAFPIETGWTGICPMTRPSFDSNGVLWAYYWPFTYTALKDYRIRVYYWKPEDRLAVKTAADYPAHPLKYIDIPGETAWDNGFAVPFMSEQNANLLAITGNLNDELMTVYVYDHKGTLDDTSDDTCTKVQITQDNRGNSIFKGGILDMAEDPNGRLLIGTYCGLFWIDPKELDGKDTPVHRLELPSETPLAVGATPFEALQVYGIKFDPFGRTWVGTSNGVYCLNSYTDELIGHLHTGNSEIGGNLIHGLGWNQDNSSLLLSCDRGIYEFTPADGMSAPLAACVNAVPRRVAPGYHGHVNVSGLPAGAEVAVIDSDSNTVATLKGDANGSAQWRPADHPSLKAGIYSLVDKEGNTLERVTIMK